MCGRYTIAHSSDEILERFEAIIAEASGTSSAAAASNDGTGDAPPGDAPTPTALRANYNVAPTVQVPVILRTQDAGQLGPRTLETAKWGFSPFWMKDKKSKPLINARAESLMESRTFKHPFMRNRCIIPADSFYEWQKSGGKKVPMRFLLKGHGLFGLAGIWDEWKDLDGKIMRSCAIITVAPNELVQPTHDRMPAILSPDMESVWLDTTKFDAEELAKALVPYPADCMEAYQVCDLVNSVRNNSAACLEPASENDSPTTGDEPCQTQLQIPFN
jgi:putative SOS response-associated peptidase YedK